MNRLALSLSLSFFLFTPLFAEDPVYFPDPNMKSAVENALWISDPTPTDMLALTSLSARSWGISDLTGLGYAANLEYLNLRHNEISDISVLCGLENLDMVVLDNNRISNISPLACLSRLDSLDVHDNPISDISPLSSLTTLTSLSLRSTETSDISALSGLTGLTTLILRYNQVSDVSPLAGLTNLRTLDLCYNEISDIGPLSGLTNLVKLDLGTNDISNVSPLSGLTNLETLYLNFNDIWNVSSLAGLDNLGFLDLEDNDGFGEGAYCTDLYTLYSSIPGLRLEYSPNSNPPGGFRASDAIYSDRVEVTWNHVCGGPLYDTYYRVYRAPDAGSARVPVSEWQTSSTFHDTTAEPGVEYTYWVQTATSSEGHNGGSYSLPDRGMRREGYQVTLSSTAGGSVTSPGEGVFYYDGETIVNLYARPDDTGLFVFAGWSGGAAQAGKVSDIGDPRASVTVDSVYTLKAHFTSTLSTLYVDDDASNDPGAGDPAVSDPAENGTAAHPFDRIQEAIEVAAPETTIRIASGTYHENLDLLGKSITLTGLDPDPANIAAYPILSGPDDGPVLQCVQNEDPNCLIMGLVITRQRPQAGPAVLLRQSSPSLAHCLIVGHRLLDADIGVVTCVDSQALLAHCTIADNHGRGLALEASDVVLTESILWGNHPEEIRIRGDSVPSITYCDLAGGWPDTGNIDAD
ncbi:MAG: leucine-rich repeat domain-containing protein, partial [Phycisphaerales bacterium]